MSEPYDYVKERAHALAKCYGITKHVSNLNDTLVWNDPLEKGELDISFKDREVTIRFPAHVGVKGNSVRVTIPFSAILAIAARVQSADAKRAVLDEIERRYPGGLDN